MNRLKWFFMSGRKKLLYQILCAKANDQRLHLENGVTLDFTDDSEKQVRNQIYEEIKAEISEQIENIIYLREHPDFAKNTIMHETPEYCRGALAMLDYLQTWIKYNNKEEE